MIPHWHPEMDVIMDAAEHRRQEREERRVSALDEIAARREAREIAVEYLDGQTRLLSPVRWPGGGPWPSGCGKHALAAPDCRDCANLISSLPEPGARLAEVPDPEAEIRAALAGPLGLDAGQLIAAVPDRPPGSCCQCHMPATGDQGVCWACRSLAELAASRPQPVTPDAPPGRKRYNARLGAVTALGTAALILLIQSARLAQWYLMAIALVLALLAVRAGRGL